jgi:hypothetical protein
MTRVRPQQTNAKDKNLEERTYTSQAMSVRQKAKMAIYSPTCKNNQQKRRKKRHSCCISGI